MNGRRNQWGRGKKLTSIITCCDKSGMVGNKLNNNIQFTPPHTPSPVDRQSVVNKREKTTNSHTKCDIIQTYQINKNKYTIEFISQYVYTMNIYRVILKYNVCH